MPRLAPIVYLLAVSSACRGTPATSAQVSDSAGVRITLTQDADRTFADIDPQPLMDLGGPDASGPTQFSRIVGLYLDRGGNVWVGDGASAELRLFQPDGTHWKTMGGSGEGPGEFRRLRLLGPFRGDSVACWDDGLARLTVFDAEGNLARMVPMPAMEAAPRAHKVFWDGTLLVQFPRVFTSQSLEPGQLLGDTARLERLDLTRSTRRELASARGPTWLWTGRSQVPLPFTVNASFDLYGGAVYLTTGPEFRIRVFQQGHLAEIYGVVRDRREVTEDDLATYSRVMSEALPQPERREYLAALDHPGRPRYLPAYSQLVVADDGTLWARVYSPDVFGTASWDVFDAQGQWQGKVRTPLGVTVYQITENKLLTVWRDSLGVEYVRIYKIQYR